MRKRLLSMLLCFVLAVGLLPTVAFATEGSATDKTIMLGTNGISDYVYFGVNSGNSNTPIKWRVLDADEANDGTTDRMFLLSEYLLASGVRFNSDSRKGNVYQGSDAQTWCSTFATNTGNFSTAEQGAMLGVTKTDSVEKNLYSERWAESSLTANDKLFFLSVRELADYVGTALPATDTAQSAGEWWLRSPLAGRADYAGVVRVVGGVAYNYMTKVCAARPAFNLNLNSVLFTSAAEGGKSASSMGNGLTAIDDYTGNEWKLTLLDNSSGRTSFYANAAGNATCTNTYGYSNWAVSIGYGHAITGENEYVSAMLVDSSNNILYYGRLKNTVNTSDSDGNLNISIPAGLSAGTYTLKVFNEQCNGDYKTDYASTFQNVTLTVTKATPTLTPSANSGTVYSNAGTTSFTYTYDGDGEVSAVSSDEKVAAVSVDTENKTITATILKAGKATITVSAAEGTNYTAAEEQKYVLTVKKHVVPSHDDDPSYSITVNEAEHGTVISTRRYAECGEDVTLTVSPEQGWTLETLTAVNTAGKEIDLNIVEIGEEYTFRMPASNVTVTATFMEDNSILNFFIDIPISSYYYNAVLWAAENGVAGGVDNIHFSPDGSCTRAQAVTFLWRAAGSPAPKSTTMPFTDVPDGSYYCDAVLWAVENGITKGTSDTTFDPNATCSRGQIVTFLYRSEQLKGNGMSGTWMFQNPFTDVNTADYYGEAVMWAVANDVTEGTTSTTFSPDNNCTRAQIVTFIYRTLAE